MSEHSPTIRTSRKMTLIQPSHLQVCYALVASSYRCKDINIQFLHDTEDHAQTLHETVNGYP